jgi:hypothetical protein
VGLRGEQTPVTGITANYGISSFMPLVHVAIDKQQYNTSIDGRTRRGRLSGSSVRLGDMEVQSLLTRGYKHSLNELMDNSDLVEAYICSKCRRQAQLCDCVGSPELVSILVREPM